MNVSLRFHATVTGLVAILLGMWQEDFLASTDVMAIGFVILLTLPHTAMLTWVGYNILSRAYICACHQDKCNFSCVMGALKQAISL